MKQISGEKICKWCLGCNRLEDEEFEGVMRCRGFLAGERGWEEKYEKEIRKKERKGERWR